jgi:DNA-binding XRE family transcriptional regulator
MRKRKVANQDNDMGFPAGYNCKNYRELGLMSEQFSHNNAPEITSYFKEWRAWRGWTQQELADEIGTTKQTVSRIESGARDWNKRYLEQFAHAVGCPNIYDPVSRPPNAPAEDLSNKVDRRYDWDDIRMYIHATMLSIIKASDKKFPWTAESFTDGFMKLLEFNLETGSPEEAGNENVVKFQLRQMKG